MTQNPKVQASSNPDLELHTLGWKAFQDLCVQVFSVVHDLKVEIYREAQDGGQDAAFTLSSQTGVRAGTVQCKFTSKAGERLGLSDITAELPRVEELVGQGLAHSYYFISNKGLDGPVAVAIKKTLMDKGVVEPHVYGKEWLVQQIRASSTLRAMVPRIYGLGDLSVILDERSIEQTRALLGHLAPSLRTYVPTFAHREAVRKLGEHNCVLLLGPPASGKSMLASILATCAQDDESHICMRCDGPKELAERWNPSEKNRLYWVDDAFGSNQLRLDYVDSWIACLPKVRAAIEAGNRFVLTSRLHIWNAAKPRLGTRNLPVFQAEEAAVKLGLLDVEERRQMIYNHIKMGTQPHAWREKVSDHLEAVSQHPSLLPEIARRLGDRRYTRAIRSIPDDLLEFVASPAEFLKETILELDAVEQAALTLIFVWRSRLPASSVSSPEAALIADKYGVSVGQVVAALPGLEGSFVIKRLESGQEFWTFTHPTLTDALTAIIGKRPDLAELYLRGASVEAILSESSCLLGEGTAEAVFVPEVLEDLLSTRVCATPDEPNSNQNLFRYLCTRCNDRVIAKVIKADGNIFDRKTAYFWRSAYDPRLKFYARAKTLGLLPREVREAASEEIETAIVENLDGSTLFHDEVLDILLPGRLLNIGGRLREVVEGRLKNKVDELEDGVDLEEDIDDQFEQPKEFLTALSYTVDADTLLSEVVERFNESLGATISRLSSMRHEPEVQDWDDVQPARIAPNFGGRSIFSDVADAS